MDDSLTVSIVILSYNRLRLLKELLSSLSDVRYRPLEIIVVDNCSSPPVAQEIKNEFPEVHVLEMNDNIGIAGRNRGMDYASGDIIITIDDDAIGVDDGSIRKLSEIFGADEQIGAVCFKIIDPWTNKMVNWCHHYKVEEYANKVFITDEISEAAVAFRRTALDKSGLYAEMFFYVHEGPDLAYRLMNNGYNIIYCPDICVKHYKGSGRTSWRRYYFDTRNLLWLVVRNYPFMVGCKVLSIGIGSMLIYSIRDGYVKYWAMAMMDGVLGVRRAYRDRVRMEERTLARIREIRREGPGVLEMVRKRLLTRGIAI